jgi:hypothetical protein
MDDTNDNKNDDLNKQKIEFFLKEKMSVHLSLTNSKFLNGTFKEKIQEGMYYFDDEKIGVCIVMAEEIFNISIRKKKEEEDFSGYYSGTFYQP